MDMRFAATETTKATAYGLLIGISAATALLVYTFDRLRDRL